MATRMQAGSFAEELHRRTVKMRQFVIDALAGGLNVPRVRGRHRHVSEQLAEIAVAITAMEVRTREFVETLRETNVISLVGRRRKIRKLKRR